VKPRLLVLNQYYWPGVEATANLLTELCEALVATYDVTVVAGASPDQPHQSVRNGVRIIRVRSTTYDRAELWRRATNYATYIAGALREALAAGRPDVIMCMTDPPFIGAIAEIVARRYRVPLLVSTQDVFPEIAVKLGRLGNPLVIGVLRVLVNFPLRHADRVVVIGETMKRRVIDKGVEGERIRVISNWGDAESVKPQPRDNPWAQRNGLLEKFAVMHFGNVGHAQDLDTLIRATTLLRDLDDLVVPIIGVGVREPRRADLRSRRARRRPRARSRGVHRSQPHVGGSRRRSAGDRGGGGRVGDGGRRSTHRLRRRRAARPACRACTGDPRLSRR
jgi:colanic acid biosynthesis glycosyl transferase WcaI